MCELFNFSAGVPCTEIKFMPPTPICAAPPAINNDRSLMSTSFAVDTDDFVCRSINRWGEWGQNFRIFAITETDTCFRDSL